jgi:hypothetical protein
MYFYAISIKQATCQHIHRMCDCASIVWRSSTKYHKSIVIACASTARTCE